MGKIFDAIQKSKTVKRDASELHTSVGAQPKVVEVKTEDAKLPEPSYGPRIEEPSLVSPQPTDSIQAPVDSAPRIETTPTVKDTESLNHTAPYEASGHRIPEIDPQQSNLITFHHASSFVSEQFRMLRTNILFPPAGKPPRIILVTSALPNEGKSFVASNLALAIAQNIDKHVLLLDCDMRKPNIHTIFGYGFTPGLSTYLSEGRPLQQLILRTAVDRLRILPAGPPPQNPSELLSSNRMADLLGELEKRYSDRFILIDSPPPHLTAETTAISRLVDGIVLVIKLGHTKQSLIQELLEKLGKEKTVGIVANGLHPNAFSQYGKGKYAPYGSYGKNGSAS